MSTTAKTSPAKSPARKQNTQSATQKPSVQPSGAAPSASSLVVEITTKSAPKDKRTLKERKANKTKRLPNVAEVCLPSHLLGEVP
jgi:hypothetical protein